MLERKAEKDIKRQQTTAEAAANMAAYELAEAHEAAMAAHLAQQAMAAALSAGATNEEAIAAGQSAMEAATGGKSSAQMQDYTFHQQAHMTSPTAKEAAIGAGSPAHMLH